MGQGGGGRVLCVCVVCCMSAKQILSSRHNGRPFSPLLLLGSLRGTAAALRKLLSSGSSLHSYWVGAGGVGVEGPQRVRERQLEEQHRILEPVSHVEPRTT